MRWIRHNRRIGAWAALFALAMQITLSFGHVHLDKSAFSPRSVASTQMASRDGVPSQPGGHSGANDYCAICATVSLVASSTLPESVGLALSVAEPSAWPHEFQDTLASFDWHFSFRARAPPSVS